MNNFADEYQKAAEYKGKNIAVSASAGCGKTTAMIKRIENIIINEHIKVNELLVVTFTRAAAAEMKNRLKSSLAAHPSKSYANSQVYDVEISDISTLHSFCSKICAEFFNIAEIPADFTIIEENDSVIYKSKILRDVIEGYYADNDEVFWELSNIFSVGRSDEGLISAISRLYNIIVCKPDGKEYLKSICDSCYKNIDRNPAIILLQQDLFEAAKQYTHIFSAQQNICEKNKMYANSQLFEDILCALSQINISSSAEHSYKQLQNVLSCLSGSVKNEREAKDNAIIKCIHEKTKEIKSCLKKTAESFLSKFAPAIEK
ncbi:MAG: UvrD-helicase domain-containing protein, partial [Clostridia bacterium]|nr:UvrD-helicase domain-containing protein [Clostridia bacterium]